MNKHQTMNPEKLDKKKLHFILFPLGCNEDEIRNRNGKMTEAA